MKNKYFLLRINNNRADLYKQNSNGMCYRIGSVPVEEPSQEVYQGLLLEFYKELSEEEATLYLLSLDIKPNA